MSSDSCGADRLLTPNNHLAKLPNGLLGSLALLTWGPFDPDPKKRLLLPNSGI